jgi:hypothetical protein
MFCILLIGDNVCNIEEKDYDSNLTYAFYNVTTNEVTYKKSNIKVHNIK